jgi:hypothetical protein
VFDAKIAVTDLWMSLVCQKQFNAIVTQFASVTLSYEWHPTIYARRLAPVHKILAAVA